MIRHIVMWKFRPGTEAEREKFLNGLRALQGVVPQMLSSEVAVNVSALCKSIREDRVAVDYEMN